MTSYLLAASATYFTIASPVAHNSTAMIGLKSNHHFSKFCSPVTAYSIASTRFETEFVPAGNFTSLAEICTNLRLLFERFEGFLPIFSTFDNTLGAHGSLLSNLGSRLLSEFANSTFVSLADCHANTK